MCFTLQTTAGNAGTAEITVMDLSGATASYDLSDDASRGDINCVWSPDGRKIAYTNGVFGQGRLVVERSDDSSSAADQLADDEGSNNFDGNADWARDGSPACPDVTVTTKPGTAVVVPLSCTDTGPEYERTVPNGYTTTTPTHGALSDEQPTATPSVVTYTPAAGFTGTDSFRYSAFDRFGFADGDAKITVKVVAPGDGGTGGDRAAPVVSGVALRPSRLTIARGRRTAKRPGALSFRSSEAGIGELRFERTTSTGRRVRGTLRRAVRGGANRLRITGRIGARTLRPGRYTVRLIVRDRAGNASAAVTRRLTVRRAR